MTSFNFPPEIQEYIDIVENEPFKVCEEQKALVKHIKRCFATGEIYVDIEQLNSYMSICEKYIPFELLPWEKFLIALHDCTYKKSNGMPRWRIMFVETGRGTGKDGMIECESFCLVSPYNKIPNYDVDICANNEEQAMRPVEDLVEALEQGSKIHKALKRFFKWTKQVIKSIKNGGKIKGRTNNPKGRDGMRSGIIIFNEVHQYLNYDNINVFMTGLGKKGHPRISYYSSNGEVREGPFDDLEDKALNILASESTEDNGFLPFICRLPDEKSIHDKSNWTMANPSLFYFPHMQVEIEDEYLEWKEHPERFTSFPNKRMGLKTYIQETAVTNWDNIKATNKPIPELKRKSCTAGVDFSKTNDWVSVNLHFKDGEKRFDINHSWICSHSADLSKIKAPWKQWVKQGHITYVDDVEIHPSVVANYLQQMGETYDIKIVAIDTYRYSLLSSYLEKVGFSKANGNLHLVKQTDIIRVVPVIEHYFIQQQFYWDDDPVLRWAANNTKLVPYGKKYNVDKGSFVYAKIEGKSRKTDPFMALVASVVVEDEIKERKPYYPNIPVIKL